LSSAREGWVANAGIIRPALVDRLGVVYRNLEGRVSVSRFRVVVHFRALRVAWLSSRPLTRDSLALWTCGCDWRYNESWGGCCCRQGVGGGWGCERHARREVGRIETAIPSENRPNPTYFRRRRPKPSRVPLRRSIMRSKIKSVTTTGIIVGLVVRMLSVAQPPCAGSQAERGCRWMF
jgi:hypothetical protein